MAKCTETAKATGERCRRDAIAGGTVCTVHGAQLPRVKAAAARRVARQKLAGEVGRLLEQIGRDPVPDLIDGLLETVTHCARMVRVYELVVAERDALGVNRFDEDVADPAVVEYRHWLHEWATLTKLALDAGIDERRLRLSELDVGNLFDAVAGALSDVGMTAEQESRFRVSLAGRLRVLGAASPVPSAS